jgi:hypothetical protein
MNGRKNGVKNAMIFDRLHHIKAQLENDRQRIKIEQENEKQHKTAVSYNLSITYYNDGINDLNTFIQYRNKQFMPEKTDPEIKGMIDSAANKLKKAQEKLGEIIMPDANTGLLIAQQQKAIANIQDHIKEQQNWLDLYLSKTKNKRKSMFYEKKTTWFGIPLN